MHFHSPVGNENKGVDAVEPASSDSPPDCRILDLRIRPPAIQTHKKTNPERIGLFVAIADKIDAVDFGIKIRKLEKMLCCNNFSHFDAWIFLIFIIGQNRCIHLNFCSGNELEDFKKDFDPSNIGILQYTPLAHAHKTIHRSQKC